MGGGQAGAPADGDHVPWTRPPWRGHRDRGWSRRGPQGRPDPRDRNGLTPGSGPRGHPLVARDSA